MESSVLDYNHNNEFVVYFQTDPKRLPLQYSTPVANGSGKTFDSKLPLKIPTYFIDLDKYDVANFTFVTAADPAHFNESKDAVAGFQEVFPEYTIVYYDLGLDPVDVEKVSVYISSCTVCNT